MLSEAQVERLFAALVKAARHRRRCPTNEELTRRFGVDRPSVTEAMRLLADTGRIRIVISGAAWRTVTILDGLGAEMMTAPAPANFKPWRVVDAAGQRRICADGSEIPDETAARRPQPSFQARLPADAPPPPETGRDINFPMAPREAAMPVFADDPRAVRDHGTPRWGRL